jgi:ribosomal protein S5
MRREASSLRIVGDRNGYSRFTINSESQVDDAVAAIRRARRK